MLKHFGLAVVGVLTTAATASAGPLTLNDFLIYSWTDVEIAGASLYIGNIGSSDDITNGASDTHVIGSVYAVGDLRFRAAGEIGTDGTASFNLEPPMGPGSPGEFPPTYPGTYDALDVTVVAARAFFENSNVLIYGTLDLAGGYDNAPGGSYVYTTDTATTTAATFSGLSYTLTSPSFATDGPDQECLLSACSSLTIAPNDATTPYYGALVVTSDKDVYLQSGDYYFTEIDDGAGSLDLYIDLTSGQPVNIYVLGDADFGSQRNELWVKGEGTDGQYVRIDDAEWLARLVNWYVGGKWKLGGGDSGTGLTFLTAFGGFVYSSYCGTGDGITFGQRTDWYGGLYACDTINLADHSRYTFVPVGNGVPVPEPTTLLLLGAGLGAVAARRRLKKRA